MPITRLMAMASVPTKSDVRAPYSTRAQTSRPTVSVPNRWPFPGPSGPRYAMTTIASGSYGVSQGAAAAASTSAPTMIAPTRKNRRLRAAEPSPTTVVSATLHPRVDQPVEQIDDQVREEHEDGGEQHRAGHQRDVEAEDGLHGEAPEAGPVEDRLGEDEAAHQRRDVEAEDRHDRDERIPQRVDEVQPFGRRALRAGGADVVARDRRGDVRVHESRVEEELHDRERRGRQDEVPDASVATQRQQPEPIAELVDQQVPEPERRERETHERRQQDRHVDRRAAARCRRDSDDEAEKEADSETRDREQRRRADPCEDHVGDPPSRHVRAAEVRVRQLPDVASVLHDERVVEAEVLADRRERLRVRLRAGDRHRRIRGHDSHEHEDDERGAEERTEGTQDPAGEIGHQALRRTLAYAVGSRTPARANAISSARSHVRPQRTYTGCTSYRRASTARSTALWSPPLASTP